MKREAWNHPKFKLLSMDLHLSLCYVRGVMESLWMATAINWPRGDIGRWTDEEIAVSIDYPGDPGELVAALIKRRLLDEVGDGRLFVHDWHEHADSHVHARLARQAELFANGAPPRIPHDAFNSQTRARIAAEFERKYPELAAADRENHGSTSEVFGVNPGPVRDTYGAGPGEVPAIPGPGPGPGPELEPGIPPSPRGGVSTTDADHTADDGKGCEWNDPLADHPILEEFFPTALQLLGRFHPGGIPKAGSKSWRDARETLERLVRLDRFKEKVVVDVLTWLWTDYRPEREGFSWTEVVQSIPGLRASRTGKDSKFDQIHRLWLKRNQPAAPRNGATPRTIGAMEQANGKHGW